MDHKAGIQYVHLERATAYAISGQKGASVSTMAQFIRRLDNALELTDVLNGTRILGQSKVNGKHPTYGDPDMSWDDERWENYEVGSPRKPKNDSHGTSQVRQYLNTLERLIAQGSDPAKIAKVARNVPASVVTPKDYENVSDRLSEIISESGKDPNYLREVTLGLKGLYSVVPSKGHYEQKGEVPGARSDLRANGTKDNFRPRQRHTRKLPEGQKHTNGNGPQKWNPAETVEIGYDPLLGMTRP